MAQIEQAFPRATQMLKEAPKATSPLGAAAVSARSGVRSLILSKPYQGLLATPPAYRAGLIEARPAAGPIDLEGDER